MEFKMNKNFRKFISIVLSFFLAQMNVIGADIVFSRADAALIPHVPGQLLASSLTITPPVFQAIHVNPLNPFEIDFLIDSDKNLEIPESEARKLVKYFLTVLTIPENDLWVNLSPNEPNKIMDSQVSRTDMGRDMLLQDYLLKQFASSLTFPESQLGQKFWNRVSEKIYEQYLQAFRPDT